MNDSPIIQFLEAPDWDAPFFKRLAHNDTGQAAGHQGGIVVPKDLRPYFPNLDEGAASADTPTVERFFNVEMFIPGRQVGSALVRYQLQTWGGTRSAESRLTDNLGAIRNLARADDIFIMQRSRDRLESFRILLVRNSDASYGQIDLLASGRRWGPLNHIRLPISQSELTQARVAMLGESEHPFVPIRQEIFRVGVSRTAIARDTAFREILLGQYGRRCSVSGIALATRTLAEVEAAHVIPISIGGADEPRNGLALTGTLHWAFDKGLFGVGVDRRVIVPRGVRAIPGNSWLDEFSGRKITEAASPHLRTAEEAFAWHRNNVLNQWD